MSKSFYLPRAWFWRTWVTALALSLVVMAIFAAAQSHSEPMRASYYGREMHGRTAFGRWNPMGLTCAHRSLPFGTHLSVAYRGRSAVVTVTDRGPAARTGRSIDLSQGAARKIGMERAGVATIEVERLD